MRPAARAQDFVYAVAEGSAEAAWAASFLPAEQIIHYTLDALGAFPTTAALVSRSNLAAVLRRHAVTHLLFTTAWSPDVAAWSAHSGVALLAPAADHQRDLEDKLRFHRFLADHDLPRPHGGPARLSDARDWQRQWVVQRARSMGGAGTWFIDRTATRDALVRAGWLELSDTYLVRRKIDGVPLGITIVVTPERVALSALRRQCYYAPGLASASGPLMEFAGVQWLPTSTLSAATITRLDDTFERLGRALHSYGFVGHAHIDFMLDRAGWPFILEANPRMSAASPHLFLHPELSTDAPADVLLDAWLAPREKARPTFSPIPHTTFAGATLDLLAGPHSRTLPPPRSGTRRSPDPRTLAPGDPFVHYALEGGVALDPESCVANVIADDTLFDGDGHVNALGQRWLTELTDRTLTR